MYQPTPSLDQLRLLALPFLLLKPRRFPATNKSSPPFLSPCSRDELGCSLLFPVHLGFEEVHVTHEIALLKGDKRCGPVAGFELSFLLSVVGSTPLQTPKSTGRPWQPRNPGSLVGVC